MKELPKPYWVNEEMKVRPNNLPGYSVESETSEQGASFRNSLSEILKLGEDKKRKRKKRKFRGDKSPVPLLVFFPNIKNQLSL
ncbi:hypothetical protein LEP1GSC038_3111 [Leptospira weilii str. 2006001855]|uniref:Uncharacterized protein n=1 Tax=Leptospira weilii str. 2006001855 TaxID=996804 RepID=M6FJF9_9LEPT|nr:hypothetical protein LEP1GSC038_3111 [Leptospira weilii str. 2006001855]